jgi:hypothetical protein
LLKVNDAMPRQDFDSLIDSLADDLTPVTQQRQARGFTLALAGWLVAAALFLWLMGTRSDVGAGSMPQLALLQLFWTASLGLVAIWFAARMAMPGVGRDHGGWRWAAAVAATVPLAAIVSLLVDPAHNWAGSHPHAGFDCLWQGLVAGLAVAAVLTLWQRQGAPTSPERAGLVTGIAAGATGITVVALHCPIEELMHVGIWHGAAVVAAALIGRVALPPLLRW